MPEEMPCPFGGIPHLTLERLVRTLGRHFDPVAVVGVGSSSMCHCIEKYLRMFPNGHEESHQGPAGSSL